MRSFDRRIWPEDGMPRSRGADRGIDFSARPGHGDTGDSTLPDDAV